MKISKQAAANCDRFEALTVGATFCIVARGSWRLIERYAKYDADRVQSITDGRIWPFATTSCSGAGCILVPDGAYSVAPYDCDREASLSAAFEVELDRQAAAIAEGNRQGVLGIDA